MAINRKSDLDTNFGLTFCEPNQKTVYLISLGNWKLKSEIKYWLLCTYYIVLVIVCRTCTHTS